MTYKAWVLFSSSVLIGIICVLTYILIPLQQSNKMLISPLSNTTYFSLLQAPSKSLRGTILSKTGAIDWQSRIATQPARLTTIIKIQQGEKIVTEDKSALSVQFGQNITVTLGQNSDVDIIQTIPTNIVFAQNSGVVEYKNNGTTPVSIRVSNLLVQQESGSIIISIDNKQPIVSVKVTTGSITAAFNDSQNISTVMPIESPNSFIFHTNTKRAVIQ